MAKGASVDIFRLVVVVGLVWTTCAFGEEKLASSHGSTRAKMRSPETLKGMIALGGNADRTREAGRLARQIPHLRVIVTGDDPAHSLQLLGPNIDKKRIEIETASRNTRENAVNTTALVKPTAGERWLLITSAWHMRRALCAFRAAGFNVEPWPVADPAMGQKQQEYYVTRERFAIAAYRLMGWCDDQERPDREEARGQKLKAQIAKLRRAQFGASSERIERPIEQFELKLEEVEAAKAGMTAPITPTHETETADAPPIRPARQQPTRRTAAWRRPARQCVPRASPRARPAARP